TDLEHLRAWHPRLLKVLVRQHDVAIRRVLIPSDDVLPRHLDVFLLAETLLDDPAAVFLVQQVERQGLSRLRRRNEIDRDRDEPEADRTLPERPWRHRGQSFRLGGSD